MAIEAQSVQLAANQLARSVRSAQLLVWASLTGSEPEVGYLGIALTDFEVTR